MRIIVDQDEVLADFVGKVLRRWNAINGTNFNKEHIHAWRMEEILGRDALGRSAEGLIDEWMQEPGFFEDLEPLPGAIEGFTRLQAMGHDVIIVTSVPEVAKNAFDGKRVWVRKHLSKLSMKNFIACSRKETIDADMIIDDGLHNIDAWLNAGKGNAVIFDRAWNRPYPRPATRVADWADLMQLFESWHQMEQIRRLPYG